MKQKLIVIDFNKPIDIDTINLDYLNDGWVIKQMVAQNVAAGNYSQYGKLAILLEKNEEKI
jgi:hypothetical protein